MYQAITIVGSLGRDPEMRFLDAGDAVTNMSVAVNKSWNDANGQKQTKTTWFRVSTWRALAEACNEYLAKGSRVLVVGEMDEPNVWTDKEGKSRADLQITARNVVFLTPKGETQSQNGAFAPVAAPTPTPAPQQQRFSDPAPAAPPAPAGPGPGF